MRTDLVGRQFGMLTIRAILPKSKCLCDCSCGATELVRYYYRLRAGWTPEKALTADVESDNHRRDRAKRQAAEHGNLIGQNLYKYGDIHA